MIKVYFESKNHAELVATFENEETYISCLPTLEKEAKKARMIVTESVEEETPTPKQLENTVLELTLRTLKAQMSDSLNDKDYDGRFDMFLATICSALGEEYEPRGKVFLIDGYYEDDKDNPFEGYRVYEFDEQPSWLDDDSIFFYGMNESNIKDAILVGENTAHEFVITNYKIES